MRCGVLIAAYALAFVLAGCAGAPAPRGGQDSSPLFVLPYALDPNRLPVVAVRIEGAGPFYFVIDTAATHSGMSEGLARSLGLFADATPPVRVLGIGGVEPRPTAQAAQFMLGPAIFDALKLVLLEDAEHKNAPAGVLGLDILARYRLVFDARAARIAFYDPAAPVADDVGTWPAARMRMETFGFSREPVFVIEARFGSTSFPALVDTGLEVSVANRALLDRLPTVPRQQRPQENAAVAGAVGDKVPGYRMFFAALSTGEISWRESSILVLDAAIFAELGYADRPFALLGYDILGQRSFAVDFENRLLRVAPESAPSAVRTKPRAR